MPIDLAAGAEALPALGPAWRAIEAASASDSVFVTHSWQATWWRHFGAGRPLHPAALPAANPLVLAAFFDDGEAWRLVGAPDGPVDLADYLDVLAPAGREREGWGLLAGWLAGQPGWRRVVLDNVPDGSATLSAAPAALGREGLRAAVEPQNRCPVVTLPGDFDAYLAGLDRDARHELRRKVRRLEREAPGASVRLLRAADAVAALPDFVRLHRLSGADKARFMTPGMERFFADMAAALAAVDRLVIARLDGPDGRSLAAMALFDYRGGWYLYNSGYDPAAARLAPGFVLLARSIEAACAARVRVFDFLRGTERYKYDLGGRDRVVHRLTIERG
jgi:CelD/BcsL family acetyltransferase involved in cellulose biosynthesis